MISEAADCAAVLALSVIEQAIRDATTARPCPQALAFLTDTGVAWAHSFEVWCGVADLDPAWARQRCAETMLRIVKAKRISA